MSSGQLLSGTGAQQIMPRIQNRDLSAREEATGRRQATAAWRKRCGSTLAAISVLLVSGTALAGPAGEGIRVHGNWTITIENADGSIARAVEFTNALVDGDVALSRILTGEQLFDHWEIEVFGTLPGGDQCPPALFPVESAEVTAPSYRSIELTRSLVATGRCLDSDGQTSWDIDEVRTWLITDFDNQVFSSKVLEPAITGILPDQVVTIKVEISFS